MADRLRRMWTRRRDRWDDPGSARLLPLFYWPKALMGSDVSVNLNDSSNARGLDSDHDDVDEAIRRVRGKKMTVISSRSHLSAAENRRAATRRVFDSHHCTISAARSGTFTMQPDLRWPATIRFRFRFRLFTRAWCLFVSPLSIASSRTASCEHDRRQLLVACR